MISLSWCTKSATFGCTNCYCVEHISHPPSLSFSSNVLTVDGHIRPWRERFAASIDSFSFGVKIYIITFHNLVDRFI